ncbi:MAG: AIR synthase-related protein, partial [Firmicutes bacterium]|nr:AIR synthase-related protein [Bacillota bacterium]
LIGLESSGIHSNGYSLVRKIFGEKKSDLEKTLPMFKKPLFEILLEPTKIYVKSILSLIEKINVLGIAHITGGGFIENIPRIFPKNIGAKIETKSYEVPEIFKAIQKAAGLTDESIYNTFNMGIGMVVCVDKNDADKALAELKSLGEKAHIVGHTILGEGIKLV